MATYLGGLLGWFGFAILKFAITPSLMVSAGYGFWETWLVTSTAAIVGVTVFYFFGNGIFAWIDSKRKRRRRVFTRSSRRTVRILGDHGLAGLSLLCVILSVPIAGLIAARFFNRPMQVLPVLFIAFSGWSLILTSVSLVIASNVNA